MMNDFFHLPPRVDDLQQSWVFQSSLSKIFKSILVETWGFLWECEQQLSFLSQIYGTHWCGVSRKSIRNVKVWRWQQVYVIIIVDCLAIALDRFKHECYFHHVVQRNIRFNHHPLLGSLVRIVCTSSSRTMLRVWSWNSQFLAARVKRSTKSLCGFPSVPDNLIEVVPFHQFHHMLLGNKFLGISRQIVTRRRHDLFYLPLVEVHVMADGNCCWSQSLKGRKIHLSSGSWSPLWSL